jgi:hypothetical protein
VPASCETEDQKQAVMFAVDGKPESLLLKIDFHQ